MSSIQRKKQKSKFKTIIVVLISMYLMLGSVLYYLQEKMLFLPTVLNSDYKFQFNHQFEELNFNTNDDAIINALHFKVEKPKGVILYFHGNAGDLSRWGIITQYFVDRQYDVLVMDYRTYGKSKGELSEVALYNDAQFCYNFLKEKYSEEDIILYGRSLGSGIATYLASKNKPKQLILETPYYSIIDVAKYRFPFFPVKKMMRYEFPSYKFIKDVTCSTLILHGTNDGVIPLKSATKLFESSRNEHTKFVVVEGGSHNDLIEFETYHKAIDDFL